MLQFLLEVTSCPEQKYIQSYLLKKNNNNNNSSDFNSTSILEWAKGDFCDKSNHICGLKYTHLDTSVRVLYGFISDWLKSHVVLWDERSYRDCALKSLLIC